MQDLTKEDLKSLIDLQCKLLEKAILSDSDDTVVSRIKEDLKQLRELEKNKK